MSPDIIQVGFDVDTFSYLIPANTHCVILRPDGSALAVINPKPEAHHYTYRGMLVPGAYKVTLTESK
jgi:hypothetical protein